MHRREIGAYETEFIIKAQRPLPLNLSVSRCACMCIESHQQCHHFVRIDRANVQMCIEHASIKRYIPNDKMLDFSIHL